MKLKYKDMLRALSDIEEERRVPESVVIDALKEAMAKAYKKDADLSDISVESEINEKDGTIDIYQIYNVVEEDDIQDDELEMSVEDAREIDSSKKVGDTVRRKVEITSMSRAAATLARNVIRQKIREAEKAAVYDEYINQLNEMVLGIVESVKDKFALINLGKTVAMLPKSEQIPGERITEGQKLRVVITEVNKDTKGSQVVVSRSNPMFVKRLFEKEVPEIYQGIVEIKAIARDAGDRTKMAVISHNEDIDPIGACIGQRGSRVQEIIEELHGEKIDIFLWDDDVTELVKNALAPAEIDAVLPEENKSLLVIVDDEQLSLAIGRKGKNARLAVKLINRKIDIKTRRELEEAGKNYTELLAQAEELHNKFVEEQARKNEEKRLAQAKEDEEKRQAAVAELAKSKISEESLEEPEDLMPEEMKEVVKEKIRTEMAFAEDQQIESMEQVSKEETVEEAPIEEVEEEVQETPAQEEIVEAAPVVEKKPKRKKADLEAIAQRNDYVSAFEKFADTSKPKQQEKPKRKKRKSDEDDQIKVRNKVLENQLRKDLDTASVKPIYTDEELEEIELQEQLEEESQYDIDYDEYEDYYNDEEN